MKIFKLMAAVAKEVPEVYAFSADAPAPIPTPPPVAPPPPEEATLETRPVTEETRRARTEGTKSLQIPLGTIGSDKPLNI